MKHSTKRPTRAESERMERLKELPCVACAGTAFGRLLPCGPTEVHHLISGNKRRGHQFTIPLGSWHHRGSAQRDRLGAEMTYGPSLALSSKRFHAVFGSDDELLAATNKMLEGRG